LYPATIVERSLTPQAKEALQRAYPQVSAGRHQIGGIPKKDIDISDLIKTGEFDADEIAAFSPELLNKMNDVKSPFGKKRAKEHYVQDSVAGHFRGAILRAMDKAADADMTKSFSGFFVYFENPNLRFLDDDSIGNLYTLVARHSENPLSSQVSEALRNLQGFASESRSSPDLQRTLQQSQTTSLAAIELRGQKENKPRPKRMTKAQNNALNGARRSASALMNKDPHARGVNRALKGLYDCLVNKDLVQLSPERIDSELINNVYAIAAKFPNNTYCKLLTDAIVRLTAQPELQTSSALYGSPEHMRSMYESQEFGMDGQPLRLPTGGDNSMPSPWQDSTPYRDPNQSSEIATSYSLSRPAFSETAAPSMNISYSPAPAMSSFTNFSQASESELSYLDSQPRFYNQNTGGVQ
jgi:hypothetical protein